MLCIITVVHNRAEISSRFTQLLALQSFQDFRLILVNDGSTDDTELECKKHLSAEQLSIIKGSGSLFWGGGLQAAYLHLKQQKIAEYDHVLICNDDIVFDKTFLEHLSNEFITLPKKHLLHSIQYFPEDGSSITGYSIEWNYKGMQSFVNPAIPNVFPTRALMMSFQDFMGSGGFYPSILKHYRSDWEFTHRLYKKGFTLVSSQKTRIEVPLNKKPQFDEATIYSLTDFLNIKWSIRSNINVRSEIVFNLLCAPWKFKALYTARTIFRFLKAFAFYSVRSLK